MVIATSAELRGPPCPVPRLCPLPHPQEMVYGCVMGEKAHCVESCSVLIISLWGPPPPPFRFRVYHPHQDGGGLPPAERRDRVRRLGPWPEGAHHLGRCPREAGGPFPGGPCSPAALHLVGEPVVSGASCGPCSQHSVTLNRGTGPAFWGLRRRGQLLGQ